MDGDERWRILRLHVEDQIPLAALARDTGIGLRTLQRWHQLYRERGISALDPHRRAGAGVRRTAPEVVAFVERLSLTRPRPALTTLYRLATTEANRLNLPVPSYATVRDIVQSLDPALVILALDGPSAYRDRHELVFRRRAERPNQTWQTDHTELDILIAGAAGKPDRPWLTVVMDDYSRAICGYTVFVGAPSAMNTALALRQAIWRKTDPAWTMCGIPHILHVDHGSDFTSHHLERTAIELRIWIIHSTVGRPQAIGAFITTYNERPHRELGVTPRDAWVADGWLPRMPDSLEQLDGLLLTVPNDRVVQRDGIHFQGQRYLAPALAPFVGHTITIRYDPRDISEIRVYDCDTFICVAVDEAHPNLRLSLRDIETARRARRRQLRHIINDRIPTTTFREEPRGAAPAPGTTAITGKAAAGCFAGSGDATVGR